MNVRIIGVMLMAVSVAQAKLRSGAVHDKEAQRRILQANVTSLEATSAENEEGGTVLVQAASSQPMVEISNKKEVTVYFRYTYCNQESDTFSGAVEAGQTIKLPSSYYITITFDSNGEEKQEKMYPTGKYMFSQTNGILTFGCNGSCISPPSTKCYEYV